MDEVNFNNIFAKNKLSAVRDNLDNYSYNPTEDILKKLINEIKNFEANLDDEHEVAVKLASFGESITINVTHIGCYKPDLIVFDGAFNGNPATLVQHVSQLNFLIVAVQKLIPDCPPRRIGFDVYSDNI